MLTIQQDFQIVEVHKDNGGFVMIMQGNATYNGQVIHTVTDDTCQEHVIVSVHYCDDDPSEWKIGDLAVYKIGDAAPCQTNNLPNEIQDWFHDYRTAQLLSHVINGTTDAPVYEQHQ